MNLEFTDLKEIQTNCGPRWVQSAQPTRDFWKEWRLNKQALGNAGICIKYVDGTPLVYRVLAYNRNKIAAPAHVEPFVTRDRSKLKDYQHDPVRYLCASLVANNIAIDASDAGYGKTYTSLAVCRELGLRPAIVCTKTGIINWRKVCEYFGLSPLFIINWESVITRKMKNKNGSFRLVGKFPYCKAKQSRYTGQLYYTWVLPNQHKHCLIFDECHKGNGNSTSQSKVMLAAKRYPMVCLSATLADKVESLRTIGTLCNLFRPEEWAIWLQKQGCYLNNYNKWQSISPVEDMRRVGKQIFPKFGVRVRKKDIPGFPDIQNIACMYPIKSIERHNKAYQTLVKELQNADNAVSRLKSMKAQVSETEKLKELTQLMREAQGQKMTANLRYRQLTEMLKVDLFVELAKEELDNGHSVVIFVNFTDTLSAIAKKLKTDCIIWGKQSQTKRGMYERKNNIEMFMADKSRIIVANSNAGGVSIDLHDVHGVYPRVAIISPLYSAITLTQCLGRIHRSGAKSKAINRLVYAAGTVEEDVCRAVSGKLDSLAALNDRDLAERDIFNLMKGA